MREFGTELGRDSTEWDRPEVLEASESRESAEDTVLKEAETILWLFSSGNYKKLLGSCRWDLPL